jgi:hypothetical protein
VANGQTPCNTPGGPDVIVGDITGPQNYSAVGTLEAMSLGTVSCNQGNVNLQWNASPANTHPVIGGGLFKLYTVDGATRFEQIGQSWLKHSFTALTENLCCTCNGQGGSVLGVGCSDPYTAARNGTQSLLGPKYPINAAIGWYPTGTPTRPTGGNNGRLEVDVADLVASSGGPSAAVRYFGQCQYVNQDDAQTLHGLNNASYREITAAGSGSAWSFGFLGSTQREKTAIEAWKVVDPTVTLKTVDFSETWNDPDGGGGGTNRTVTSRIFLAYKITPIAGGMYHYEYAVYNLNSHRSVGSFSIPIGNGATLTNIGFHDVAYRAGDGVNSAGTGGTTYDGTDWPATQAGGALTWATTAFATHQGANAIRWGTQYNFRFDTNAPPTAGLATLGLFRPGTPDSVTTSIEVPSAVAVPCPGDLNHDGVRDLDDLTVLLANYGMTSGATADDGDMDGNGNVDLNDLSGMLSVFGVPCP